MSLIRPVGYPLQTYCELLYTSDHIPCFMICLQAFFIDHNTRTTTFIDPRLPVEILDPTASLLQVPRGRMRSRSEGEEDIRSNGYPLVSYLFYIYIYNIRLKARQIPTVQTH